MNWVVGVLYSTA